MIKIYRTLENEKTVEVETIEKGCWINITDPTDTELEYVSQKTGIMVEFLKSALDEEESSRLEIEEDQYLFIFDIPFIDVENKKLNYYTIPLGIVLNNDFIVTICLEENKILEDFVKGKIKSFYTYKKSRFILQILYRISTYYLNYLKQIDKTSSVIEARLHRSMKNKELIQLLELEKSLVYFSTSLKANEITLEKMLKLEMINKYPEDQDVLEDVIIENKQAIEMANIYSNILSGTMDAFASIISNNLNIVMKFLASITIVISIPSVFAGLWGMNVPVPFAENPFGFYIVLLITAVATGAATYYLAKKDMF
ncbi:magnesium transporter CorA family protein [Thermobrachium celere]|uniref:Magnesium and cobalt transport protein CorA n=1 Tax=Thermobrachium celere DSM 8682 TaxID=941824 RepID=R7RMF2_9CLOT|nr:magnesium transporter CorA family protein [Thermobrachium celere]GFR34616.1 magnesium transporter [Thermobrachium celere]CDF57357.1 Magnesium and cobalt transport protein CorA [Thermobrachium celere DSM 8682]